MGPEISFIFSVPDMYPLMGFSVKNWASCLALSSPVILQASPPKRQNQDL